MTEFFSPFLTPLLAPADAANAYVRQLSRAGVLTPRAHERACARAVNVWNTRIYGAVIEGCDATLAAVQYTRKRATWMESALALAEQLLAVQAQYLREEARRNVRLAFAY
jgi:hypothetical protein